jgi:hypothetical protein
VSVDVCACVRVCVWGGGLVWEGGGELVWVRLLGCVHQHMVGEGRLCMCVRACGWGGGAGEGRGACAEGGRAGVGETSWVRTPTQGG